VLTNALFPANGRATAQGFFYNIRRGISALAPVTVGKTVDAYGFTSAFYLTTVFYFLTFLALLILLKAYVENTIVPSREVSRP
jgi:sugar phosphate permease